VQPLINVVTARSEFWPQVQSALITKTDPHARYVAALIAMNTWRRNRQVAALDNAPLSAERDLIAAEKTLGEALNALQPLVEGADKVLAARAAGLLSEVALSRADAAQAEQWLSRLSQIEAREAALRATYASALAAQNKLPQALAARDEMLRTLSNNFNTLGRVAKLSDKIDGTGDEENTATVALQAANIGQVSPDVSASDFQIIALLAARSALYANKAVPAAALYNGLSNEQWDVVARAVALIDWEAALRDMERTEQADAIAARITALGLTPAERSAADRAWGTFNASLN
jgi:hypothetical protein